MYMSEKQMSAVNYHKAGTLFRNWDIQTVMYSSNALKNMNLLRICIKRVSLKENQSSLTKMTSRITVLSESWL